MKNLLVPIDGSSNSLRALDHAMAQGQHGPITIHLLNVEPPRDDYGMVRAYVPKKTFAKLAKAQAERALAPATKRVAAAGIPCKTHAVVGDIAPTIAAMARRLKCDSIVMGTRGMGTLGNLVLGSVATKVVHLAKVPVTLVK